jgi:hypothetical protein
MKEPIYAYALTTELRGLSPQANYTDQATATCWRSYWQLFVDRGCHVVSVTDPYGRILRFLDRMLWQQQGETLWTPKWRELGTLKVRVLTRNFPVAYKPEDRGFESRSSEILNLPNPSGGTRPWGLLSLTEMSTGNITKNNVSGE